MLKRMATLIAILAVATVARAQSPPKLAGTYAIRICPTPCSTSDSAQDLASGFMVLEDGPVDISSLPLLARYRVLEKSWMMNGETANACFSLRKPYRPKIMAGIIPEALSVWRIRRDTLWVRLYVSPDASYSFRAIAGKGPLAGIGVESASFGPGGRREDQFTDVRRIGPPDISKCFPSDLIAHYMSTPEPTDNNYKVSVLLDRRDQSEKTGDSTLVKQVYTSWTLMTNERGETFYGYDSIAAAKRKASRQLRLQPRTLGRIMQPRFVGENFAYIEEELETSTARPGTSTLKRKTRFLRISIAERLGDRWLITREITAVVCCDY